MARGDMLVENKTFGTGAVIFNRPNPISVPMTIDFTNVSAVDSEGRKIVKAGTPIDKDGVPVVATPWTGAIGILLHDTIEAYPTGAIIREGYINTTRAQANTGLTFDAALVNALLNAQCDIKFEEPFIVGTLA